ncbi:hypothetical protein [Niabella hirudinis]|uniref:hypothetical protein n=1 Tax=Niabella hirudinis TaxID=1285929 RepID=UPI003EB990AD
MNKLAGLFWLRLFLGCGAPVAAQNPQLTIDEAALIADTKSVEADGYNYNHGLLSLLPNIMVKGNGDLNPVSGAAIPLGRFTATYIRGTTTGNTVTLSTSLNQSMTSSLLESSLLSDGLFKVKYEAPALSQATWLAGTYSNTLAYTLSAIGIGASVTPAQVTMTVIVPAFINASSISAAPANMELTVNDLKYFRNTTLEFSNAFQLRHTVPVQLTVAATSSPQMDFTNSYPGVADPQTSIGKIQVQMGAVTVPLGTTSQPLVANAPVLQGNKTDFNARFFISPTDLKAGFINKGSYKTTVVLQGTGTSGPAATYNKNVDLLVTVNDLSELVVSATDVTLSFQSAENYKNGVAVDMANHLRVSKTTPYDISVKALAADFTGAGAASGVTLPVGILELGPASGQTGVNTISALSATDQLLVSSALPAVDRYLNIRYRVPASGTQYLINKPAGTYVVNIRYTLTAH